MMASQKLAPEQDLAKVPSFLEMWIVDLESVGTLPRPLLNLLERAEEERLKGFRIGADRRRYLVSRILLRLALSYLIGGDPRQWRFITGETGKVNLAYRPGMPPIDFNISHSENALVIALSSMGQVGVDIEQFNGATQVLKNTQTTLGAVFTSRELGFLAAQPEAMRWQETLKLWTCKEAYAKLLGLGLHMDFTDFDLTESTGRVVRTIGQISQIDTIHLEHYELKLRSDRYHLALAARPIEGRLPPAAIRIVDPLSLLD